MAPNLTDDGKFYLLRPTPGFADPPLCTVHDLRTWATIDDLADFHETLDLRGAMELKAHEEAEADARQRSNRR